MKTYYKLRRARWESGCPSPTVCLPRCQVLAAVDCPALLDRPGVERLLPPDVIARARWLGERIKGGTGAYSHSQVSARSRGHTRTSRDVLGYERGRCAGGHEHELLGAKARAYSATRGNDAFAAYSGHARVLPTPECERAALGAPCLDVAWARSHAEGLEAGRRRVVLRRGA